MKPIIQSIVILIVGSAIILGTGLLIRQIKQPEIIKEIIEKPITAPECPADFLGYLNLVKSGQSIQLISNAPSYALKGKFFKDYSVIVERMGPGEIGCGYLYVQAHLSDERYDSIYINPQGFGGHILRLRTILIPTPVQNTTEVLLSLNSVSYLPTVPYDPESQNYRISDWVKLLNVSNEIKFDIALSTLNPLAIIDEVRIAYKCWNPTTGKETKDCQMKAYLVK